MISAIILAAGRSTRMGRPKMLLPWGGTTVLGQVIETLRRAGIADVLVVTGGAHEQVEEIAAEANATTIHNEDFESEEMLASLQCGLRQQKPEVEAALVCLGDQPQVEERSVRSVCEAFRKNKSTLVAPSYQMRRGHPWLVGRALWGELLQMRAPQSPRDFLNAHEHEIEYVIVDTSSVITDLDTPEDFLKSRP